MNKALNFAKEFIDTMIIENKTKQDFNNPFEIFFNNEILENDTNLEILKKELNKLDFKISKTNNPHYWTISKIN